MTHPVLNALKTARQALATAGLLGAVFGMPLLMAGGIAVGSSSTDMEEVTWMGTGSDDNVVVIALDDLGPSGSDELDREGGESSDGTSDKGEEVAQAEPADGDTPKIHAASPQTSNVQKASVVHKVAAKPSGPSGSELRRQHSERRKALRASRSTARGQRCDESVDGIEQIYGDRYRVDRDVLDTYTTLEQAMKLARVAWHKDADGKVDGFKLYRVRCGSPLTQVGLRSGDVIHAINGRKVRTLPQAFNAVRKVKRHDVIRVDFSRGGQARTVTAMVE